MKFKKISNSTEKISVIGLGTGYGGNKARLSNYDNSHVKVIRSSIDLGVNFLDTAEEYGMGEAEKIISKAIHGVRHKVFISTKVSSENLVYKNIIKSVEGSLKRLKTDYIDLYQNHWLNPLIPFEDFLRAMDKLINDGKIRYIGLSNVALNDLIKAKNDLKSSGLLKFVQLEYNLVDREIEREIIPFCNKENILIAAYSPLLQGMICRNKNKMDTLNRIAKKYKKSVSQIVLNWIISENQLIAIVHTNNLKHLKENAESPDFDLLKSDLDKISAIFSIDYKYIDPKDIYFHPFNEEKSNFYTSIDEAYKNKFCMVPSPKDLAIDIMNGRKVKPIKIKKCKINNKKYNLIEGELRYWASVIADTNEPVLSIILDD